MKLLRTTNGETDAEGTFWYPVAAWAVDPDEPENGFPWRLDGARALSFEWWDYGALVAHLVSGLQDVFEHTWDDWGWINEDWHCDQLVPNDWVVRGARDLLGVSLDVVDQFLLWRTLHTRIPSPLLEWYSFETLRFLLETEFPDHPRFTIDELAALGEEPVNAPVAWDRVLSLCGAASVHDALADVLGHVWRARSELALRLDGDACAGPFGWPGTLLSPFDVTPSLTITLPFAPMPDRSEATARLLSYALVGELPHPVRLTPKPPRGGDPRPVPFEWHDVLEQTGPTTLQLRPDGLAQLRTAIVDAGDLSGRIGTFDGGDLSDESLRLLLRARLENVVGPPGLWAQLGLLRDDGSAWRLPIPERYTLGARREAEA